jgi:hypothetical protein
MSKKAWIDGDVLKYLAGFAVQKTIWTHSSGEWFEGKIAANDWLKSQGLNPRTDWVEEDWTSEIELEPFSNCTFIIEAKIGEILSACNADEAIICLTPAHTFRHDVAVTKGYKAHRSSPKPEYSDKIIKYFHKSYNTVITDGLEADDIMGMGADTGVIATNDKDLDMVPGEHFNFTTGEKYYVDPTGADEWFYVQLLAGDATDNIQGIPGMGIKTAQKVVEAYDIEDDEERAELLAYIENCYADAYGDEYEEVLQEHAELVYILRPGDTVESQSWRRLIDAEETT